MLQTSPTQPYDWTYTTTYAGHSTSGANSPFTCADPLNPAHAIPIAELSRRDPILFYAEVPLFEDELHDNGSSSMIARVVSKIYHAMATVSHPRQRVMHGCLFILLRFCLRVDHVLCRVHDTRIFHSFASHPPLVVKETNGWEAQYSTVKRVRPGCHAYCLLIHDYVGIALAR